MIKMNKKEFLEEKNIDYKEIDGKIYIPYFYFDENDDSIDVYLKLKETKSGYKLIPVYVVNSKIIPEYSKLYSSLRIRKRLTIDIENIEDAIEEFYNSEKFVNRITKHYINYYERQKNIKEKHKKVISNKYKEYIKKELRKYEINSKTSALSNFRSIRTNYGSYNFVPSNEIFKISTENVDFITKLPKDHPILLQYKKRRTYKNRKGKYIVRRVHYKIKISMGPI